MLSVHYVTLHKYLKYLYVQWDSVGSSLILTKLKSWYFFWRRICFQASSFSLLAELRNFRCDVERLRSPFPFQLSAMGWCQLLKDASHSLHVALSFTEPAMILGTNLTSAISLTCLSAVSCHIFLLYFTDFFLF